MVEAPEAVAEDPYGAGWFLKIALATDSPKAGDLLSAAEYRRRVEGE
jgi:glycine cleavage system H protein